MNQFNPYQPQNPMMGFGYSAPRPQARNTQPLTPEQINKLRQDSSTFDMKVDQEDLWRAACTHKEKTGGSTLIDNRDGTYTCSICHETFKMCDNSRAEIEEAVTTLCNMLQTCKTVYLDAPEQLISQYFQQIPLLKKFPELWDRAMKNFAMYDNAAIAGVNPMSPGYSGFQAMNTLLSNPYGGGYMGGMAPMAPQGMPQMAYDPSMGYYNPAQQQVAMPQMNPMANPVAYGAPMPGMMPGAPMGVPVPTQQAPMPGAMPGVAQPAPVAAPVQQAEVHQQQTFNV